jgi:hypothetical protein
VTGAGWEPGHLVVMLAWGVGAAFIAARTFKWEPNTDGGGGGRSRRRRNRAAAAS